MARRANPLLVRLISCIGRLVPGPALWLPIQLPVNVALEAVNGSPCAWASTIHVVEPDVALGFWLWSSLALASAGIWGMHRNSIALSFQVHENK